MVMHRLLQHSLKTRIALLVLALSLAGVWSLALYAGQRVRQDMREQILAQQASMASLLAQALQRGLAERTQALQAVAALLSDDVERMPQQLEQRLRGRVVLQQLFNGGTFVTDSGGEVIVAYPQQSGRLGQGYGFSEYVQASLAGQTVISHPMLGHEQKRPLVILSTPVRGVDGSVLGVLAGVIDLGRANFIDALQLQADGRASDYAVVARQTRTVITASEPMRTPEVTL